MLQEVLQNINNYFINSTCDLTIIESNGLTVSKPSDFIVDQYVLIIGSKLNDGVYQISSIVGNKLFVEVEYDLFTESGSYLICGLSIPRAIHTLVSEITEYNLKTNGVTQESLGDYSVSYANENGDASWITSFRKKLAPYKKPYLNLPRKTNDFGC